MSHVSTVQAKVKDLDALETAAAKFEGRLERGAERFTFWRGQQHPCVHRLVFPGGEFGPVEVGLQRPAEGGDAFLLAMDNDLVRHRIGRDAGLLRQAYSVEVATRAARQRGMRVLGQSVQTDGSIKLRLAAR